MATFTIADLSFTYPGREEPALSHIGLTVEYGEFVLLCGPSGGGKSTLLRNLKTALRPHGERQGEVLFYGRPLDSVENREQAARIGYVFQSPDNQIVTDKVWHEMAFGLESLGYDKKTIRLRVSEMASFFGIQSWFHKSVEELSGGQKQILNLASVMAMQPDVLILDEPTAQLDPIAAGDFLETVRKINREIGTTVLMSEQRLEDVLPMADRMVVMDGGCILVDAAPAEGGRALAALGHPLFRAMPTPMQAYYSLTAEETPGFCPITVREGRTWLTGIFRDRELKVTKAERPETPAVEAPFAVTAKDVWFRYGKEEEDVIKDLRVEVPRERIYCIVGGNGSGKSTALGLICGIYKPYRGKITLGMKRVAMLPQNPQTLFVESSVEKDLLEILEGAKLSPEEKAERVQAVAEQLEIRELLQRHPWDLSGGEQQRAALAKVLLTEPELLLLDEPTKGLDSRLKEKLAELLRSLRDRGMSIIIVSHDIEFCGRYGDLCAMFFDGNVVTVDRPGRFFAGNSFYTTAANRMSRHIFEEAVTVEDVTALCRQNL